jgi:putative FmdB family regulatory protein
MPTYEYTCKACKKKFSAIMSIAEHEKGKVTCPKCKSAKVEPRFTSVHIKTSRKS